MKIMGSLRNVASQIVAVFPIVDGVFENHGFRCTMTSCWRDKGRGSLHPYGLAADFDAPRNLTQTQWDTIEREVRDALGDEYDVIAHASPNWHLHVEYDPRG